MIKSEEFCIDKVVIERGTGTVRANEFSVCQLKLKKNECITTNSFDYATDSEIEITLGLASTHLSHAVDLCVQTMTSGEVSRFTIRARRQDEASLISNNANASSDISCKSSVDASTDGTIENGCGQGQAVVAATADNFLPVSDGCCDSKELPCKPMSCDNTNSTRTDAEGNATSALCAVEINLLSFSSACDVHLLSGDEYVHRATLLKDVGVTCFKNSDVTTAFYKFARSLKYLLCADAEHVSDRASFNQLMSQCYTNVAACQLQVSNFAGVIESCTQCLTLDSDNVKGLFRRARASMELRNYESAARDLEHAVRLEPNNKTLSSSLADVRVKLKANDEKLRQGLSKMFVS